jgi:hypothetical protein
MRINDIISRVKAIYNKGIETDDSRLSDRLVYDKLKSTRSLLIKREIDKKRQVSDWIVQSISCFELVTALPNDCTSCSIPPAGCKILKSKNKLPKPIQSVTGPELESVTTMDGDKVFSKTNWVKKRYKSGDKYTSAVEDYFIKDGHLFITTNSLLKYISISGVFEDPLEPLGVNGCEAPCINPLEQEFYLDGHLTDAVVEMTVQQLVGVMKSMPEDSFNNAVEDPQRVSQPQRQAQRPQQ